MARSEEMAGVGVQPEHAKIINGTQATVAATGSSQSDAALLTASDVKVTGADGTKGVILPSDAQVGDTFFVCNVAGSGLNVYPPSGESIAGESDNAAKTVSANTGNWFKKFDNDEWLFG